MKWLKQKYFNILTHDKTFDPDSDFVQYFFHVGGILASMFRVYFCLDDAVRDTSVPVIYSMEGNKIIIQDNLNTESGNIF